MNRIPSFLLAIVLVGCASLNVKDITPTPVQQGVQAMDIGDGGLITGIPCSAPCFFGVYAGKTQLNQVVDSLSKSAIDSCHESSEKTILCDSIVIEADPSTQIVNTIGYVPSVTITLEELISKYGKPTMLSIIPSGIPEYPATTVLVFFDTVQMRVRLPEIDGVKYAISPLTDVDLVVYFDNSLYEKAKSDEFLTEWTGFGTYEP
ncbi:MAG: hypothetical protein AB1649_14435 [Chloroflexota bacterium]